MLQNVPCFDIVPLNYVAKCLAVHCRRNAPTLFTHGETTGRLIAAPTWRILYNFVSIEMRFAFSADNGSA